MNTPNKFLRIDPHSLYEKMFEYAPDAVLVTNHEGRILEANPQAESLFGYACDELVGNSIEILVPKRFQRSHIRHREEYGPLPRRRPMSSGAEFKALRKDGTEFPVDIMLHPVETQDGAFVLAVIRDVSEQKRLEEEMRKLVLSDPLTELGNYRRLLDAFETETKWFQRTGRSCALLLLDLDGLKAINDTHGHLVGNRVLCRLADALRAECRSVDVAVRHGGDEFAVIMPDTNIDGARSLASRVATRIAADVEEPVISFSFGVGICPQDGETLDQLLDTADNELYEMKRSRR